MFKSLFGKNKNKENDPISLKLKEIDAYFTEKDYEKVISEAKEILDQVSKDKKADLIRTLALSYSRIEDYGNASLYFQELCKDTNNSDYVFNLCMTQILNNEPEKGLETLEDAISLYQQKGKRENMPIAHMIFYTLTALSETEQHNLAFEQLDRLAIVYKNLSITDPHFLRTRGYMPISAVLEKAHIILENQSQVDSIEWLNEFASHLDENGQLEINDIILEFEKDVHNNIETE
ncbi:tol-pal system YbgF family protein [Dysgonomonas sp. 520]|uniref:tetratricopeptide repeat protein n=1 Tax=Dysgonomonas sp. 520 TaxID=2302931 RepID=UPI0013D7379F|nr:hypothetical protein [Dysgonomonas sp. 520]NDW09160.1 hypothetical protein [Dysgonomonas sp. 520]